jgi:predicted MFS family arabinose efflux permease
VLVDRFGWSAVFSFRAPVALAAFLLAWTLPRQPRGERETFDAAGGVLLAAALSFLLLTLNRLWPPNLLTALFAIIAVVSFVLFHRQEHRAPQPIIDFAHFRRAGFTLINVMNVLNNVAAFSIMLLAPFYLSRLPGLSLPEAGLLLGLAPFGIVLAALVAGRMASGISPRIIALIGCAFSALGLFGISLSDTMPNIPLLAASMAIEGFGIGLFQVAYFDIVTEAIPAHNRGVAGALGMATRTIGTVTGATVLMLIFQSLQATGDGFVTAFQMTFRVAAALPVMLIVADVVRGLRHGRCQLRGFQCRNSNDKWP